MHPVLSDLVLASLLLERYPFEGQFDHDRRFANRKLRFLRQLCMGTRLMTALLKMSAS